MDGARSFDWHIRSEPASLRLALRDILRCLDRELPGQTAERRSDLRLILSELLSNAVMHGNGADARKQVHLRLRVEGALVCGRITDEGQGFYPNDTVNRLQSEGGSLREHGRGIQIASALADVLAFDKNGRRVTFVKRMDTGHE